MAHPEKHQQGSQSSDARLTPLAGSDKAWLREFSKGDLPAYWQAINDPEIAFYTGHCSPISFEEVEKWYSQSVLNDPGSLDTFFAICQPGSDSFIGTLWLWNASGFDGHCELSIFISVRELWETGIASEAVRLGIDYAFKDLGLEKVWLHVDDWNQRAINCYERCGFEREGLLRRHRRLPDGWSDMVVMSVLRSG